MGLYFRQWLRYCGKRNTKASGRTEFESTGASRHAPGRDSIHRTVQGGWSIMKHTKVAVAAALRGLYSRHWPCAKQRDAVRDSRRRHHVREQHGRLARGQVRRRRRVRKPLRPQGHGRSRRRPESRVHARERLPPRQRATRLRRRGVRPPGVCRPAERLGHAVVRQPARHHERPYRSTTSPRGAAAMRSTRATSTASTAIACRTR